MRLKRVISAALAVSMAVSMMPATAVSAFAEETSTNTAETTTVTGRNSTESEAKTNGPCGKTKTDTLEWSFNESTGVLTISGAGDMADYSSVTGVAPWKVFANKIIEIQIGDQVTGIGTEAFNGLENLTKVNIPASIARFGSYIFNNDKNLVTVDWAPGFMAPSVQDTDTRTDEGNYVPTGMFDHCSKLGEGEELTKWLPSSFTGICCAAFRGTKFTVDFNQLKDMKYWGPYAFASMDNLDSVTLTEDGPKIGELGGSATTFEGSGLKKMVVNTKVVPAWIAGNCKNLETVELGNDVTRIETGAFSNTGITELKVPKTANEITIESAAFVNNSNLKSVTLNGNVMLKGAAFAGCGIENFTVAEGAKVVCNGNPFSVWGDIAPAVISVKDVKIMGTLEATEESGVTHVAQTTWLWNQMFPNNTEIEKVTVNGANLQYIVESTFPSLKEMYVDGGNATTGYKLGGTSSQLEKIAIDVDEFASQCGAFRDLKQLKTISIKANTAKLGGLDFTLCPELKVVDLSQCGTVQYNSTGANQDCFGSNASDLPSDVKIYVNNEEANPHTHQYGISQNYGIVFVVNGGTVDADNTVTKAGYTFDGWYENADFTGEAVTTPVQGKTYYAKWTKNKYTVTLDNNGHGEQPDAISPVEYGAPVTDLPKKLSDSTNEWVFTGWYTDAECTTEYKNEPITKATTLYAGWRKYTNTSLTAKVSKSDYLVNTPADVNVTVTPGDDFSKLMQDKDNIKISLTYDDDVTSVMLNGKVLDKKEYTISELMPLMGQNREHKLNVTYGKAGTHTFGIVLKNGDKIVCEAGTDITVVQALMDTTVTEDGEQKETYQANKPITVEMNVTADKETFKQNTLYLTYGDEVEKVELNGHKLTEKQYKISDLLDMMETSPVAAYALRSEADALSIPFEVTFKDAGSYNFEMLVKDAQDQLVCQSVVPITVEAEKKPDDTKPATYTLSILGGTVKVNGKETAVDEHGDIAIAKDAKVEVTFDKGILSDAQTFDQWIIKPNSVLNAVDPKSETIIFTMPDEKVTIEAMTKDASIEDEPNILGTAAVVGTAAAGTAILAWQGYQLGTELYLKTALPAGTAIPTNRAELALLVWNHAGKPAPAAVLPADATDTQKAIAWAVENDLLKAAKDNGETYVDTDSVSRVEVIRVWNKAQEK